MPRCLVITVILSCISFVFMLNVLSKSFADREKQLIDRNNEIIDRLMTDPNYFNGYKSAWDKSRGLTYKKPLTYPPQQ